MKNENELQVHAGIAAIKPYQPGKPVEAVERELGIARAIKLASNENPLGPSAMVKTALRAAAGQVNIYPDGACHTLQYSLAKFLRVQPGNLILGNGSNELLVLLGRCYLQPGDEVLTSENSFVVYSLVAHMMNARLVTVPLRNDTFDLAEIARAITDRTRIIYICNPNNPTGTAVAPAQLKAFVRQVPPRCLVVLDEAYFEYMERAMQPESLEWVVKRKNLAVLRTFSKAYGLAGLRVGYGVVPQGVAQAVNRVRDPFNVNLLAQIAATAAIQDQDHVRQAVRLASAERKRVSRGLEKLGLSVAPSQANFVYARLNGSAQLPALSGQEVYERLLRQGVIVRPFPGPHLRITLGTPSQNSKLIKALKKVLGTN